MPRLVCPSWRWMTISGTPSRAISTAWAWRSWCGAKRRRTPASAAVWRSCSRAAPCDQACPRVGPVSTQNSGPTGSSTRTCSHCCQLLPGPVVHADLAAAAALAAADEDEPRRASRSASVSVSASWMRSPARQSTTISPRIRKPWGVVPAWRMTVSDKRDPPLGMASGSQQSAPRAYPRPMDICPYCSKQIRPGEDTARVFDPSIPAGAPTRTVPAHIKCIPRGTPMPRSG